MTLDYIDVELLRLMWHNHNLLAAMVTLDGSGVEVIQKGFFDPISGGYTNAEVSVGGQVYKGNVLFSAQGMERGVRDDAVLHVVANRSPVVVDYDGDPICQVIINIPANAQIAYRRMKQTPGSATCGSVVAAYEPVKRVAMFTRLLVDRLERKAAEVDDIYNMAGEDWNETLYIMLLRTIDGPTNKETFGDIAKRVRYSAVSRERDNIVSVESMLFGASGLLSLYSDDGYTHKLKMEFDHLSRKYTILPMSPQVWNLGRQYPRSHPVLRIAQLAALFCTKDFSFDSVMSCRGVEDLHRLFGAEASEYWTTHFIPNSVSSATTKRLGVDKAELLGINFISPLMFAYGRHVKDETLQERAVELLENIFCESNQILTGWRNQGVQMKSAFDTQAILQLNKEFCMKKLCGVCPVGKNVIKNCL